MTKSSQKKNEILNEWVEAYTDALFSWAFHKTSSKETAEDLVQDTFVAAFSAYDKFEERSRAKTWLFSILNNKIIDHYRKQNKRSTTFDREMEGLVDGMFTAKGSWNQASMESLLGEDEHLLDNPKFNEILEYCIEDLPDQWQIAVNLKYILQRKSDEICTELNITKANYWQVIHRSKLLLKKCIEKYWAD
jgi:RNA polymerase sigma-70 factor (ECF subfamily)